MYPIFSEDEFDIEEMERDPEERRLFDWYTDLLWDIATTTPPFACDGKCEAPSGYFIGEPWMAISSSQEKEENETSLAVRTGEEVGLSCQIWIGRGNSATKFTTENVTITVEGTEIYKKETDPNTGVKRETHRDQDPRFKIHVREERSASGHSSEFKISIDSFGEDMVGNVTCENGVASNNSAVALVHRVDCSYGDWSTWSTCSRSCLASDGIQGQKMRNRTSFPPQNGGDPCTASLTDTTVCAGDEDEIIMCPVNHSWTSWSHWSPCSPKCGLGKQDRSRSCTQGRHGGTQCPKLLMNLVEKDTKRCKIKECPACNVEEWQKWSPCTKTCLPKSGDPGTQRRRRLYHEADPSSPKCVKEDNEEVQSCAFTQCPVNATMGRWTTWGPPDAVCGLVCKKGANATRTPIMQSRMRPCIEGLHGGQTCDNLLTNEKDFGERMNEVST